MTLRQATFSFDLPHAVARGTRDHPQVPIAEQISSQSLWSALSRPEGPGGHAMQGNFADTDIHCHPSAALASRFGFIVASRPLERQSSADTYFLCRLADNASLYFSKAK